jgi:small subunit ribosomal protein S17
MFRNTSYRAFGLAATAPLLSSSTSGSSSSGGGLFARTPVRLPWWNFATEQKVKNVMMRGGNRIARSQNAKKKIMLYRFKKNGFPNRTRQHWNVAMTGVASQRPRRMPWPYDISSMIFNQPKNGADKIGYVVGTGMLKTAVVAANYLVYYPKFNQRVSRTGRYFAHDEDMACVDGDLVHIKHCRKISKYKHYYIFSILEPNVEGRERLKLGMRVVPPPLFGYPTSRRIVKLNLTSNKQTKVKLASSIQEQVQDFYKYAGPLAGDASLARVQDDSTFDEANKMIAPNAAATSIEELGESPPMLGATQEEFTDMEHDSRLKKGEDYWMKQQPADMHDYTNFTKAP